MSDPILLYAVVARGKDTILADCQSNMLQSGDHTQKIFEVIKVLSTNYFESCLAGKFVFYVINDGNFSYIAMCTEEYKKRLAFGFLEEIKEQIKKQFSQEERNKAISMGLQKGADSFLKERVRYYNSPECDKLWEANTKLQDTQNIMTRNLEKTLERGFKLEVLVQKTDLMQVQAQGFKREAQKVRRYMWWQSQRLKIFIGLLVLLAIYIIISLICGFDFNKCKANN